MTKHGAGQYFLRLTFRFLEIFSTTLHVLGFHHENNPAGE